MSKPNKKANTPRVPASLVGYVHNASANAVRVAKSRGGKLKEVYDNTEGEILAAIDTLKVQVIDEEVNK